MNHNETIFEQAIRESATERNKMEAVYLRCEALMFLAENGFMAEKLDSQVKVLTEHGTRNDLLKLYTEANEVLVEKKVGILQKMASAIRNLIDKIKNFIDEKIISHFRNNGVDNVEVPKTVPTAFDKIKSAMNLAGGNIKKLASKAVDGFKNIDAKWLALAIPAIITTVAVVKTGKKIGNAADSVGSAATKAADAVSTTGKAVSDAATATADAVGTASKAVGDAAKQTADTISSTAADVKNAGTNFITISKAKAIEMLTYLKNTVLSNCNDALKSVDDNKYVAKILSTKVAKTFSLQKFIGFIKELVKGANKIVDVLLVNLKKSDKNE